MIDIIINIFREFNSQTALFIVFALLVLLGSIEIEWKDGRLSFRFRWTGLRARRKKTSKSLEEDGNTSLLLKIISVFLRIDDHSKE
jgi:hypothetical protein